MRSLFESHASFPAYVPAGNRPPISNFPLPLPHHILARRREVSVRKPSTKAVCCLLARGE